MSMFAAARRSLPWMAASILLVARPAMAQRGLTEIPPPDPAAELEAMQVAEGYEVNLFAADPMLSKPLQINFDTQGRLWVSTSSIYPQIRPGEAADDTVVILEDRDGDGRADTSTRFADGLLMPTAVLPDDRGGAYVANSTEMLHYADTDGDGRADGRRVVLSGFGAEDTHHIIHTFRWGPDARFYFNQSIYIHSHIETPKGVRRLNGGGIWRLRPERPNEAPGNGFALDVFSRGWVNTWGHVFDRWGRSLATDGAGGEGIHYAFPGAAYQAAVGTPRVLHGMNPGSPKYCGLELLESRHLPDDARGILLTNDFRANRVCRFRLTEKGSGFTSEKLPDLIHSKRVTFRPIDVKVGPDGAVYIADWYNPIIQHGEVDFRDERRDRTHGRIWRVTAKGRPLLPRIDFTKRSAAELLAHLRSPDAYERDMAKREMFARGVDVVMPALGTWLASLDKADPDFERLRLEGLRLKQGLDRDRGSDVDSSLLAAVLASTDSRARAAACRIVADWADRLEDPTSLVAPSVDDPAPQVRLEAVRTLAAIGGKRAAELALHAVDHDRDEPLDYAIWLTARELRAAWLPAMLDGSFDDGGKIARVLFAVQAAETSEAVPRIMAAVRGATLSPADRMAALACIAALGSAPELRLVFDTALDPSTGAEERRTLLTRLVEAHQRRRVVPAGDLIGIEPLVVSGDHATAALAISAAAAWKVAAVADELSIIAKDDRRPLDLRRAAIAALGGLDGDGPRGSLVELATLSSAGEPVAAAAIAAIAQKSREMAAAKAAAMLAMSHDAAAQETVYRAFLGSKDGADLLAKAIDAAAAALPDEVAKKGQQAISASGRPEPALARAIEAARSRTAGVASSASSSARHAMNDAEFAEFVGFVRAKGDRARGEVIYKRENMRCVACHRIGDQGARVGPNLAAIGAASPIDYIVDSLVHPSKNVKEGYNTLVVLTNDGVVTTGIPVSRTDDELVLRDANEKLVTIRTADIDEESPGTSLMPAGLVDTLSREEFADLVRYLSELGK